MIRRMNFFVVTILAMALSLAGVTSASAAESLMVGPGYVTVTPGAPAAPLLTSAAPGTSTSFNGDFLEVNVQTATTDDVLALPEESSASTTAGAVSVVNSVVYVGDGSMAARAGVLDNTRTGGAGTALRVNIDRAITNAQLGKIFTSVTYRFAGTNPRGSKSVNYLIGSGSTTLASATQVVSFSVTDAPAIVTNSDITIENRAGVADDFGVVTGSFACSDADSALLYTATGGTSITRQTVGGISVNKKVVTGLGDLFFNSTTGEWAFVPLADLINAQTFSTTANVNLKLNRVPFTFTVSTVMVGGLSAGESATEPETSPNATSTSTAPGAKKSTPSKPKKEDSGPAATDGGGADAAIGATGDDSIIEPFDPLGSPETIAALSGALVLAVSLAGGVTAATSRGGSSSAAPAEAPAQTENARADGGAELEALEATEDVITIERRAWGDKLGIFALAPFTFLDKFSHDAAIKVAPVSPMMAKLIVDGSYLRAIVGSLSLVLTVVNVVLAAISLNMNDGALLTPPWQIFVVMAVIGTFDAFAGFVAALVFISGSFISASQLAVIGDYRMMFGVLFVLMGPGLLMTAFRALRKDVEPGFNGLWERATDVVIAPLMAGVSVTTAVTVLPALAGLTLPVANHIITFGIAVSIAAAVRVLLEELATKGYPHRLNTINPSSLPTPPWFQQAFALLVSYGFWVFLTGAISGDVWQIYVGSFFFLLPAILGKFADRFPNSVWLWRIMPQGMPGLVLTLVVAAASAGIVMAIIGANPTFAAWNMIMLPLPILAISLLGLFGRHGATEDEVRFSQRNPWLFRVGGVVIVLVAMKLMNIY